MSEPTRQTMQGRIDLDGKSFVDIAFQNAELVYDGGTMPTFHNCTFNDARFTFQSTASNTVLFLRSMLPAQTGMRQVVLGLMPEFQQN